MHSRRGHAPVLVAAQKRNCAKRHLARHCHSSRAMSPPYRRRDRLLQLETHGPLVAASLPTPRAYLCRFTALHLSEATPSTRLSPSGHARLLSLFRLAALSGDAI